MDKNKPEQIETDLVIISAAVGAYLEETLSIPAVNQPVPAARQWSHFPAPKRKTWKWSLHPYFSAKPKNIYSKSFWAHSGRNELLKRRVVDKV